MKRLTTIEYCGLALGVVLFLGGLVMVIWPQSGVVAHFSNDALGMSPRTEMEVVTKTGSRVYGIIALLLGAGIALLSVYRGRSDHDRAA